MVTFDFIFKTLTLKTHLTYHRKAAAAFLLLCISINIFAQNKPKKLSAGVTIKFAAKPWNNLVDWNHYTIMEAGYSTAKGDATFADGSWIYMYNKQ
jgi:hypothetical protein